MTLPEAQRILEEKFQRFVTGTPEDCIGPGGIVEKMRERGMWCKITAPFTPDDNYHAGFTRMEETGWNGTADYRAEAASITVAIVLAAAEALKDSQ